jgi:hypothetical protein
MSRKFKFVVSVFLLTTASYVSFVSWSRFAATPLVSEQDGQKTIAKPVSALAVVPDSGFDDSGFFLIEANGEGNQFFGTMDKIGVVREVMDQFPGLETDFIQIRDQRVARLQYLASIGSPIGDNSLTSKCLAVKWGTISGQTRVRVDAIFGKDIEENGGVSMDPVDALSEIWSFGNGGPPQLLERQRDCTPDGVHTQAEVSTYQPPLPPVVGGGY